LTQWQASSISFPVEKYPAIRSSRATKADADGNCVELPSPAIHLIDALRQYAIEVSGASRTRFTPLGRSWRELGKPQVTASHR